MGEMSSSIVVKDADSFKRFMYNLYKFYWMSYMRLDLEALKRDYIEYALSLDDAVFVTSFEDYVTESGIMKDFCESFDKFIEKIYPNEELIVAILENNFSKNADIFDELLTAYRTL